MFFDARSRARWEAQIKKQKTKKWCERELLYLLFFLFLFPIWHDKSKKKHKKRDFCFSTFFVSICYVKSKNKNKKQKSSFMVFGFWLLGPIWHGLSINKFIISSVTTNSKHFSFVLTQHIFTFVRFTVFGFCMP